MPSRYPAHSTPSTALLPSLPQPKRLARLGIPMVLQGRARNLPLRFPGTPRASAQLGRWAAAVGGGALALAVATPCHARSMDPALSRLMLDPNCAALEAPACAPDRALYYKLVSQLGFALAPSAPHEARTTGLSGFEVSLLGAFTAIDA